MQKQAETEVSVCAVYHCKRIRLSSYDQDIHEYHITGDATAPKVIASLTY